MSYTLGPVKAHVKSAAESVGPMFGIKTVYGWRPVDPYPDHPSGLALDFMTSDYGIGRSLAEYFRSNAGGYSVKYIIHWRQIWSVERASEGWRKYTGSNPHVDHVHVTFYETAGTGIVNASLPNGALPTANPLDSVLDQFKALGRVGTWKRIAIFVGGASMVVIAAIKLTGFDVGSVLK